MKKFKKYNNIKYLLLLTFIVSFACTCFINTGFSDDIYFKTKFSEGLFSFLLLRYNGWSSRLLIECVLVILLQMSKIVWITLNSLMITLLIYGIDKIFNIKNKFLLILILLLYPWYIFSSAGWYATTLNYLWPLSLGLFTLVSLKQILTNEPINNMNKVIYILALLFACNQEQMCAILFGFYTVFLIYILKNKIKNSYFFLEYSLIILSMVFILTCPGNQVRMISETGTWYPAFASFNLIDKGVLGVCSTVSMELLFNKILIPVFLLVLPVSVFDKSKNKFVRFISLIPISMYVLFKSIYYFNPSIVKIDIFLNVIDNIGFRPRIIGCVLVSIVFLVTIFTSVYNSFKGNRRYLMVLILLAGYASRFMIGFSPTIYASVGRTFTFLDLSILIVLVNMWSEIHDKKHIKFYLLLLISLISFILTMVKIYMM